MLYIARYPAVGTATKPFAADEAFLRELKSAADRAGIDMIIEVYNPNAHAPLARRAIVSHKAAAFVR